MYFVPLTRPTEDHFFHTVISHSVSCCRDCSISIHAQYTHNRLSTVPTDRCRVLTTSTTASNVVVKCLKFHNWLTVSILFVFNFKVCCVVYVMIACTDVMQLNVGLQKDEWFKWYCPDKTWTLSCDWQMNTDTQTSEVIHTPSPPPPPTFFRGGESMTKKNFIHERQKRQTRQTADRAEQG